MIGIISYLPNDESLRKLRKLNLIKVINFLKELFPNELINIVAQNFRTDDYIDNINYIKFDTGIGAVKARNIILKKFYQSNDDYLYLTDDDILMYDYYDAKQFIIDLYYGKYNDYGIDMVTSLTPDFSPFKEFVYKEDYIHNHILKRASLTSGTPVIILRNIKKFYNNEIYYNADYWVDNVMAEDVEFISNFIYSGYTFYKCINWIKKLLNKDDSTVFNELIESRKDRTKFVQKTIETLCIRYSVTGIKDFNNKYNKTPTMIYVPRRGTYTITENLIPNSQKNKNKLF